MGLIISLCVCSFKVSPFSFLHFLLSLPSFLGFVVSAHECSHSSVLLPCILVEISIEHPPETLLILAPTLRTAAGNYGFQSTIAPFY
ncbi:hypothetical protein V6Z12_D02G159600 [Gossypium hirsutum]